MTSLSYAKLTTKHPSYYQPYWKQLRALHTGGKRLLDDAEVLEKLMPRNAYEAEALYKERLARALYFPYPASIVGDLVSMLGEDPLVISAEPAPDQWYATFSKNVDQRGTTLSKFAQHQVRTALICRTAWVLVDLPPEDGETLPENELEEERLGRRDAWLVALDPEQVTDWEEDEDGCLLWACVSSRKQARMSPSDSRSVVVERFTFYFPDHWERFEVAHDKNKRVQPKQLFKPVASGVHSFGQVPLLRLELPEELWALDKLFSAARAFFNQRSAFSWSQYKHLFPLLVAFLGPEASMGEAIPSEAQQNPARATQQVYGQGHINTFGKDDELKYVAPPEGVFAIAAKDLDTIRDEMHRVTSSMALALNTNAATVGRSGKSKEQDKSAKEIVAKELGRLAREHVQDLLKIVGQGRRDADADTRAWQVGGFQVFDSTGAQEAIESATSVAALDIPSPTFHRVHKRATATRIVRHDATPEEIELIKQEIDENVADEAFAPDMESNAESEEPDEMSEDESGDQQQQPGSKRQRPGSKRKQQSGS